MDMLELKDLLLRDMGMDLHLGLKLQVLVLVVLPHTEATG